MKIRSTPIRVICLGRHILKPLLRAILGLPTKQPKQISAVKMKSAMLTVVAALVFVALMLTGCTTECEVGGCTYTISSACCDAWKGGESTSDACSNDDDTKAIIEDGLACVGDALR